MKCMKPIALFIIISIIMSSFSVNALVPDIILSDETVQNKTVVTFVCDDLSANDWNYRDVFTSRGLAYTIPTVVNNIGSELSLARLLTLQNEFGYEIGSHGVDHVKMTEQSPEELTYQLSESKVKLRDLGFKCNNFFVPFGAYNQGVLDEAKEFYRAIRTSDKAYNNQPFNLKNIKGFWSETETLEQEKAKVDTALENGSWLVLSFHTNSVNRIFMEQFIAPLLDYIKSKNIPILTFDKALDFYNVPKLDDFNPIPDDTLKPVFSGISDTTIELNSAFDAMSGITAIDNIDGDVTSKIIITGNVDVTKVDTYILTYTVSDEAGNIAVFERIVTVVDNVNIPSEPILNSLPDGTKDEISGDYTIIRRVGVITFDGSQEWLRYAVGDFAVQTKSLAFKLVSVDAINTAANSTLYISSNNITGYSFDGLRQDGLEGIALTSIYDYTKDNSDAYFIIRILKNKCNPQNATGLKTWLTNNIITIKYPLKTPYIETVELPINSYNNPYVKKNNYLTGLDHTKNSIGQFMSSFKTTGNAYVKVFNTQLYEVTNGSIGTGMIVKLYINDIIKEQYTIVLFGDINGDALINLNDLVSIRNYILECDELTEASILAGDLYNEGNITLNDLVGIMANIIE